MAAMSPAGASNRKRLSTKDIELAGSGASAAVRGRCHLCLILRAGQAVEDVTLQMRVAVWYAGMVETGRFVLL
jgi:hypothetical protein